MRDSTKELSKKTVRKVGLMAVVETVGGAYGLSLLPPSCG